MTTIDSDSESQDSDDGRRFRFEATRKDDTLRLQSHNKRRSPLSKSSNYRSRSADRSRHNRRDSDKTKQERDRKEGANDRDKRKNSKERDPIRSNKHEKSNNKESRHTNKGNLKDVKEPHESRTLIEGEKRCNDNKNLNQRECKDAAKNSSNSKDYRNSKDSRLKESKNIGIRASKDTTKIRETKDLRDHDVKSIRDRETKTTRDLEVKNPRDRDRGPKRTREVSHERSSSLKHGHRSREKYRSDDRSNNRDRSKQLEDDKTKEKVPERKIRLKKQLERKILKRDNHSPSKILEQIGSDSESDLGALDPDVGPVLSLDTYEDCKEMNLSDFDIISDTEGTSSDSPDTKSSARKGAIIRGEILAPHYYGPKIKKRVSRRQYERLVRKQAALNTRRLEEIYKVNPRNDVAKLAPSNNNPSAVSDFLLGPEASMSAVGDRRRSRKSEEEFSQDWNEDQELQYKHKLKTEDDQDLTKFKRLQIDEPSLLNLTEGIESGSRSKEFSADGESDENYKEELLDSEIYGPALPPKCEKNLSLRRKTSTGTVEKADENSKVAKEVGSPSHRAGHSRSSSLDKTSSSSLKKSISSENKSRSIPEETLSMHPNVPVTSNENKYQSKNVIIGPSLPPEIRLKSESPESNRNEVFGPTLPGQVANKKTAAIIGPSLPPHLRQENTLSHVSSEEDESTSHQHCSVFGPTLPSHLIAKVTEKTYDNMCSDSEDDIVGPMPANHPAALDGYIQRQLEDRARRMRDKLDAEVSDSN